MYTANYQGKTESNRLSTSGLKAGEDTNLGRTTDGSVIMFSFMKLGNCLFEKPTK